MAKSIVAPGLPKPPALLMSSEPSGFWFAARYWIARVAGSQAADAGVALAPRRRASVALATNVRCRIFISSGDMNRPR